jgi:hypothetical protein
MVRDSMIELIKAAEGLAAALLESAPKKKKRKLLLVAAFRGFDKYGKPIEPAAVAPGDDLYLRRPEDTGAGMLVPGAPAGVTAGRDGKLFPGRGSTVSASTSTSGRLYATALEAIEAGTVAEIAAAIYEKRWETDADPCDVCLENATVGWIGADEVFPSGDEEPDAHPNCKCDLMLRRAE